MEIDINMLIFNGIISGSVLFLTFATKYINQDSTKLFKTILSSFLGGIIGGKSVIIFNEYFGPYPTLYYTCALCGSTALYLLQNEKYFD